MSEEFEASESSGTRTISFHSSVSSDFAAPLSPDDPLTHVSPTPTPTRVSFHHRTARMARYISSYEIPSPSSSLTIPVRKRHMGTSELIKDNEGESSEPNYEREGSEDESSDSDDEREGNGLDDEGQGLDDEGQVLEDEGPGMQEATPEGQQQAVLVIDTAASEPLGLRCGAARRHSFESSEEITPSTYETPPSSEWSLGSLPVLPSSSVVPSPIASLVATLAATISRLDVLPPTLFEGYDKDLRELYTMSGAVRDEIFS
uniref:Uncharacterized protein n=1 Tax=Tanacetum cinerariifolium TaxID=118510 RepID=A0A699IKH9_TANCI|nr:hypothetical protein [Tanacetum cinerariifolium]